MSLHYFILHLLLHEHFKTKNITNHRLFACFIHRSVYIESVEKSSKSESGINNSLFNYTAFSEIKHIYNYRVGQKVNLFSTLMLNIECARKKSY